jgi:protoheme IX farnesyltransferase
MRALIGCLSTVLELTKFKLCLSVTLSASAGFVLAEQGATREIMAPLLGTLLLSCGSCGLNQYQERHIDRLMERTRRRPLPAGRMSAPAALSVSLALMAAGSSVLFLAVNSVAGGLGLFAVLWYNGLYSYLKRSTTFAVIAGALVGAVPPAIGWVSAGGSLLDPRLEAVSLFFFLWQVPHCWLLSLGLAKDYEKAGFPTLSNRFSGEQIRRMIFIWMACTAVASLVVPLFLAVEGRLTLLLLLIVSVWFVRSAATFLRDHSKEVYWRRAFVTLNIYVLLVISLLSMDRLLQWGIHP